MFLKGYKHRDIQEVIEVSPDFIGKRDKTLQTTGISRLKLADREAQSVI
jgi:hypothetical protein